MVPEIRLVALAGWTLWCLGYPTQAIRRIHEALARAQELTHPYSLGVARLYAASLYQRCRDAPAVQAQAGALITLATTQGLPLLMGFGSCLQGWALAMQSHGKVGIEQMHQGLAVVLATGHTLARPF